MNKFKAYNLVFNCQAQTAVNLPLYNGTVLRGALFGALRQDFCLNKNLAACLDCPAASVCPICRLVATVEKDNNRGAEIPRPFALQPVVSAGAQINSDRPFTFGITLFGEALALFPYVVLAVQRMGEIGMGDRRNGSGRFVLRKISARNPLSGVEQPIYTDDTRLVKVPELPVTHPDVVHYSGRLNSDKLRLILLTPLRLIVEGSIVHKLTFRTYLQRLLRRMTDLSLYFCGEELDLDFSGLLQRSAEVQVIQDNTRWIDLSSYSGRRQSSTPVGGLIGDIVFEGNLQEFLPFIVWGQITHVGKDSTRGNGWYQIAGS